AKLNPNKTTDALICLRCAGASQASSPPATIRIVANHSRMISLATPVVASHSEIVSRNAGRNASKTLTLQYRPSSCVCDINAYRRRESESALTKLTRPVVRWKLKSVETQSRIKRLVRQF